MITFPKPQAPQSVFAFQSRGILGYTLNKDGANLPVNLGPWRFLGERELHEDAMKIKASVVVGELQGKGFYLIGVEPVIRDTLDNTGEMIAER